MAKFARIIELENNEQVLLTINYNDEDDNYEIEIRTDFNGISAVIKLGFKTEERALKVMEEYDKVSAERFRKTASSFAN